jgi:hypothetical protein
MGCVPSQHLVKVQRSTAIEVLDEAEYKLNPENVMIAKCKSHGQELKIHFRPISLVCKVK